MFDFSNRHYLLNQNKLVNLMFKHYLIFIVALLMFGGCQTRNQKEIPMMSFSEFEPILQKDNDTVYIINFWATWCKPCITELPGFEKLNRDYKGQKVKVLLVSLDFPDKHEKLLVPFVEEHNLQSQVIHLTDTDANAWIDKVSMLWSGSIPATLIYKKTSREFYEIPLDFGKLKAIVDSKLQ
jgi:thiol-disulfide isomerase/thioredoxin